MIILRLIVRLCLFGILGAIWLLAGTYLYLSPNLPNVETLRDVKLQTPMLVYSREGELIGQFGEQKRSPLLLMPSPSNSLSPYLRQKTTITLSTTVSMCRGSCAPFRS
jgi:penicillin-binding protein 1A